MQNLDALTYKIEELPAVLKIGRDKAYQLANSPGFPAIRLGKRILVSKIALEKWLESQSINA